MLNIHEELKVLVVRNGTSMRKIILKMREKGSKIPEQSNLSNKLKKQTIKFKEVQEILDFMGYRLKIEKK